MKRTAVIVAVLLPPVMATADAPPGPREAFKAYSDALAVGDLETAKKFAIADAKRIRLIDERRPAAAAEAKFKAAVDKAFPGSLTPLGYGTATTRPEESTDPLKLVTTGDRATLTLRDTTDAVKLRRVRGDWKVDLDAMYTPAQVDDVGTFRNALIEAMNAIGAEVTAGRFKTFAEVQAELETRIKMRLATPDLPVTTRPAF